MNECIYLHAESVLCKLLCTFRCKGIYTVTLVRSVSDKTVSNDPQEQLTRHATDWYVQEY
jgi:hypothetical protein